jgi:hypothetical protein
MGSLTEQTLSDYSNGPVLTPAPKAHVPAAVAARSQSPQPVRQAARVRSVAAAPRPRRDGDLRAHERRIPQALVRRHPGRLTVPQLGALSRLSHKGGTFSSYFGELQRRELIDVAGRDDVGITEAGFEAIGADPPAEPQSPAEMVAMWRERLPASATRILDALIEVYPEGLDREELAVQTGLTASGGTFGAAVGMLRRYALAEPDGRGLRVSAVLVRRENMTGQ